ncbi:MAG: amidohydrolase family protein [bacterium]|nr:amidohydrolase family protein [bacterium]
MPLPDDVQLISVDDHVIEHANVWLDRLPSRYRTVAPQIKRNEVGHDIWHYEGKTCVNIALNAVAGKTREEYGLEPVAMDDIIPGCYDPLERIKDMDLDGIQASLNFPSFAGFAGSRFAELEDPDLALACVQAYNDWHIEEWCGAAPDRFIPLVILPYWDIKASVAEIRRTVRMGAKAISFSEAPQKLGEPSFYSDHWDPLLREAHEASMPLCMHFGTGGAPSASVDAPFAVSIALFGMNSQYTVTELLFSPVFRKFPELKVCLSEGGIGWIPYVLERCDYTWERHRYYQDLELDIPPSELFRDHVFGCFIADEAGLDAIHRIGVDQVMWECDYPHSDSNWPNSRKMLMQSLANLSDGDARKIAEDNARRVFNFTGGR